MLQGRLQNWASWPITFDCARVEAVERAQSVEKVAVEAVEQAEAAGAVETVESKQSSKLQQLTSGSWLILFSLLMWVPFILCGYSVIVTPVLEGRPEEIISVSDVTTPQSQFTLAHALAAFSILWAERANLHSLLASKKAQLSANMHYYGEGM